MAPKSEQKLPPKATSKSSPELESLEPLPPIEVNSVRSGQLAKLASLGEQSNATMKQILEMQPKLNTRAGVAARSNSRLELVSRDLETWLADWRSYTDLSFKQDALWRWLVRTTGPDDPAFTDVKAGQIGKGEYHAKVRKLIDQSASDHLELLADVDAAVFEACAGCIVEGDYENVTGDDSGGNMDDNAEIDSI